MTSTDAPGADSSMWGIRIAMPLVPPKKMSHNARGSRWDTTRVSKLHRKRATEYASEALREVDIPKSSDLLYDVEVYWGSGRLRCDEDGLSSMMKPILDGISDAMGSVSDRKMHIGVYQQGRAPDGQGWMAVTLRQDNRSHDCGKCNWDDRDSLIAA